MAGRTPLFLARPGYRSRRLSDAARALPVLGMFLLLVPVLWSQEGETGASTATVGIYLFIIWALLIAVAALLAPRLPVTEPERTKTDKDGKG